MTSGSRSSIDWTLADSEAHPWDDGHVPEGLMVGSSSSTLLLAEGGAGAAALVATAPPPQQYLRVYPRYHHRAAAGAVVRRIPDAAPPALAEAVYRYTTCGCMNTTGTTTSSTWGSYVTLPQIRAFWEKQEQEAATSAAAVQEVPASDRQQQEDLALRAAAAFLGHYRTTTSTSTCMNSSCTAQPTDSGAAPPRTTTASTDDFHGVAVWALASGPGSRVPYHVDHAELLRYERGVTVLPALAGTWQVTPRARMEGGVLGVVVADGRHDDDLGALEHYRKHGYKGALSHRTNQNENFAATAFDLDDDCRAEDSKDDDDDEPSRTKIQRIPYKFNQMILMPGHLPHWSTRVRSIVPADDDDGESNNNNNNNNMSMKRVIVGFNVFLRDVGPFVQEAPEHSEAFRQRVQQRRRNTTSNSSSSSNLSLERVKANPALRRCLVLAKRAKVKQDYERAVAQLDRQIEEYLSSPANVDKDKGNSNSSVKVHDVVHALEKNSSLDVHVHIHHGWKEGRWRCFDGEEDGYSNDKASMVPLEWFIELLP